MKEHRREDYKRIIHSKRWSTLSRAYKAAHPLCEECLKKGILDQPSEEVHHIRPISTGRSWHEMVTLAFDPDNLEALCHDCHTEIHRQLNRKRNGKPVSQDVKEYLKNFGL